IPSTRPAHMGLSPLKMRIVSTVLTALMLGAIVLAGMELTQALAATTPGNIETAEPPAPVAAAVPRASAAQPVIWPALFGEPQPPAPPAPPPTPVVAPVAEEPQPPAPPRPPLSSLGYTLKGTVRAGDAVWGLVSHPTGQMILRRGDMLADGMVIARIDGSGIWVDTGAEDLELMGYPE
ncbi:hypothetical protein KUV51_21095, partial [Tateyamaria omphalii]|uniref:hypothetical protein n=1 Tax=Tateyamaria omphalii TaxID=299262 RepID=UPI00396575C7|nr:hypothetical protein [Tateyamaria omphalii]